MSRDFQSHVNDLRRAVQLIQDLTKMPERVTEKDLRQTITLMETAAEDIAALLTAALPGCICRRVQDDGLDYLVYAEGCRHHQSLYHYKESLKANYTKMEKPLKDEVRLKLVAAALTGTATSTWAESEIVRRAIDLADGTIDRLLREDL